MTHYALLCFICDLKAAQRNMQCCLNWELMLYKFELSYNTMEATKNICYAKDEGTVDHSTVTRWFKKFCSGCNKLNDWVKSGMPKTVAVLQAI